MKNALKEAARLKKELEETRRLLAPVEKRFKELNGRRIRLEDEFSAACIAAGVYRPMKELVKFDLSEVFEILFVVKSESTGKPEIFDVPGGEFVEFKRGRFYYSDYDNGIISWNAEKKRYVKSYWGHETVLPEFLGFFSIEYYGDKKRIGPPDFSKRIPKEAGNA